MFQNVYRYWQQNISSKRINMKKKENKKFKWKKNAEKWGDHIIIKLAKI